MVCYQCGTEIKIGKVMTRTDECPACGSDLHCCLNCINYDPSAHNRCKESQAEWVADREKANFCDYFLPNTSAKSSRAATPLSKDDARQAFDSLFKK